MTGEHHLLIIEDDSRTAELHTSMLRRERYEVDVARDGVSRIDLAGSWLPDAVILEVTSPSSSSAATIAPIESGQW
jgi:DNA-binding response OmpR family regulator